MSYILDALKKNQLDQEGQLSGINPYQTRSAHRLPQWLVIVLIVALCLNLLFMLWFLVLRDPPSSPAGAIPHTPQAAANTAAPIPPPRQTTRGQANVVERQGDKTKPVESVSQDTGSTHTARTPQTTRSVTQQSAQPVPKPTSPPEIKQVTPAKPAPPPRLVQLRELSAAEQTVYNGFTFTSHIFTDDPSECAIVIDGQRLVAGDAFKGLKIVRITEAGVVFSENRRGKVRHVEVSVIEQWDKAS